LNFTDDETDANRVLIPPE
jgi:hypothetical protein